MPESLPASQLNGAPAVTVGWLGALFDQTTVGMAHLDPAGRFLQVNGALCTLLGYSSALLLQLTIDDILTNYDQSWPRSFLAQLDGDCQASVTVERLLVRPDNAMWWGRLEVTKLFEESTRLVGLALLVTDVTARKQLEAESEKARLHEELARREAEQAMVFMQDMALRLHSLENEVYDRAQQLETVQATMIDIIAVHDTQGRLVQLNDAGLRTFGYTAPLVPDEHHFVESARKLQLRDDQGNPMAVADFPAARVLRGEVLSGPTNVDMQMRVDGHDIFFNVSGAPLRDQTGAIIGSVTVSRDVTERRQMEEERLRMLNIVAHELRTPLTTIKLAAQLTQRRLQRAGLSEADHIQGLLRDIVRMEHLVNDLLASTRADIGMMQLNYAPVDLAELCQKVAEEQRILTGRQVNLNLVPVIVRVDANRITQVISNLLSNALKYSPGGTAVTLKLTVRTRRARLAISDEGQGIPRSALPHIFEHSYRVPGVQVLHGSSEGLGLGLYVCQSLVSAHGSTLRVRSAPGKGSTFWFELPVMG